ncbi:MULTISPECIES: fimbrial protein [Pseudomonas]|uniref:fimbrial protein n=1 Tax=Pseudomonas TaxID=286 RepID=UPI0013E00E03|nr:MULTISPECIES: fimbrial protein [Pseudomonas]MCE0912381.1 type 1 fimbrial protein [Pseudomonas kurunegalensis]QIG17587.1 type 1 fimbrial protein [Pseudomonas monteilii]QIG22844.1 type 1 fimbrial protein [Pseudomonas monteilii]WJR57332.1 fimbrial protein [Pseudomonas kurunegalensis]
MTVFTFTPRRRMRLAACCLALGLGAGNAYASCSFSTGATYMTFERDIGTFWVPRDAAEGTVIGTSSITKSSNEGAIARCVWDPANPPKSTLPNTAAIFAGSLPPIGGKNIDGHVMETNIPGIGVYIELGSPFDGVANNSFVPDSGSRPVIPYSGTMRDQPFNTELSTIRGQAWLIKTGPIAPGPQRINGELFHGYMHNLGKMMEFRLSATVNQAQCSLKTDAVSADPVQLGSHPLADFKGVGSTTPAVPFNIRLSDCEDASAPNPTPANVHLILDGANGSVPTVPAEGRFSLGTLSDAAGIEIQLLRGDGSPMPLQSDESVKPVSIGITQLDFQARYYQSAPTVKPGVAEGGLTFTVTYK